MKQVFDNINKRKDSFKDHPIFEISLKSDPALAKERFEFWAPGFIHLSMTFRDINTVFLPYKNPENDYQREISEHAAVDAEHWHMLLKDLDTLGLNKQKSLNNAISEIWDEQYRPAREYMYSVVNRLVNTNGCHFKKMALMESGEAGVKLFFGVVAHNSEEFERIYKQQLYYFGNAHVEDEIAHAADLSIFDEVELDPELRDECIALTNEHFDGFKQFLDYKYQLSKDHPAFQPAKEAELLAS